MMRMLSLLAILGVFVTLAYFSVLFWGLGRTQPEFSNALLEKPTPWLVRPWDRPLSGPWGTGTEMVWIDVHRDSQGLLRAVPSAARETSLENLPATPSLKEVLHDLKVCCAVVNVLSNVADIDQQVNDEISKEWDGRILMQSEFDPVLLQLKKQRPLFAYGTSSPDRLRWLTYESLRLLPAVTFDRDVYVSPLRLRKNKNMVISDEIVSEVHRRKRKIMLGPVRTPEEALEAKKLNPDAYFILDEAVLDALR